MERSPSGPALSSPAPETDGSERPLFGTLEIVCLLTLVAGLIFAVVEGGGFMSVLLGVGIGGLAGVVGGVGSLLVAAWIHRDQEDIVRSPGTDMLVVAGGLLMGWLSLMGLAAVKGTAGWVGLALLGLVGGVFILGMADDPTHERPQSPWRVTPVTVCLVLICLAIAGSTVTPADDGPTSNTADNAAGLPERNDLSETEKCMALQKMTPREQIVEMRRYDPTLSDAAALDLADGAIIACPAWTAGN